MKNVTVLSILFFCCLQLTAQPNNLKRMWTSPYVLQTNEASFSFQIETQASVAQLDSVRVVLKAGAIVTQAGKSASILTFLDDGLEDDLVANDRVYTASNLKSLIRVDEDEIKIKPKSHSFRLSEMQFFSGGNRFSEQSELRLVVRYFNPISFPGVNQVSPNFQHTSYVANVVDEDLEFDRHNIEQAYKTYYDHLPDDRHSMIAISTEISFFTGTNQGQSIGVSNEIEGIGLGIYDKTDQFYSDGVLEQRIVLRNGSEDGSVFTHELHHRWGVRMPPEFHMGTSHWTGAFEMNGGGGSFDKIERIVSNGDSTYNVYYNLSRIPGIFHSIDMYLAGYGPLDDIKFPIKVIPNPTNMEWDTDGSTIMYSEEPLLFISKDLILEKLGVRSPDYLNARREQRVGLIVRSQRLMTPAELSYFHKIMVENEKTENSIYSPKSYYELCHGAGRLITRISDDIVSVENKFIDQSKFKIFPNPASSKLNIELFSKEGFLIQSGQIINSIGEFVLNFEYENGTSIDIQNLSAGVYFLKLKTEEGIFIKQFVKTGF